MAGNTGFPKADFSEYLSNQMNVSFSYLAFIKSIFLYSATKPPTKNEKTITNHFPVTVRNL